MRGRKDRIVYTRQLQDDLLRVLSEDATDPDFEIHEYLGKAFNFGDFFYYVFNFSTQRFDMVSAGIKPVFGIEPHELDPVYFKSRMHPSDLEKYNEIERTVAPFLFYGDDRQQYNYRLRYDCRVLHPSGSYIRILHQVLPLKSKDPTVPFRIFGVFTDISHLKMEGEISFSLIGLNNAPTYMGFDAFKNKVPSENVLSQRETQILLMLSEDMISKEIAEKLFISTQTVANHRKNMLMKTGTKSSVELLMKALRNGWV